MILLSKYDAYRWEEKLSTYVKGYFHDRKTRHEDIIEDMLKAERLEDFTGIIKDLNGEFSAVRESDDFIFAGVDYLRSFPLFYAHIKGELVVSDSPDAILRIIPDPTADRLAMKELRISGTTFGDRTLYQEIRTLGAGEALFYDKKTKKLSVVEYFDFSLAKPEIKSDEEYLEEMEEVYSKAFESSLQGLEDETLVVPIRNAWWERLMMRKIKDMGLKKVILYSYGSIENKDVEDARKIAEYYGYPWYMIEYTGIDWFVWYTGTDYRDYKSYSTLYNGVPNIEEYLAIKSLYEKSIIPQGSIFMNVCFTGFVRGDILPKNLLYAKNPSDKLVNTEIMSTLASNVKWRAKDYKCREEFLQDIFRLHWSRDDFEERSPIWKLRYAYWKERVGKYSTNARRIYEMFGYRWRNVQMDRRILDYWAKLPEDVKYKRTIQNLYDKKYNQDLLDYLGAKPIEVRTDTSLNMADHLKNAFPEAYRKHRAKKKSRALRQAYDLDPLLWYNIVSRRDFEQLRPNITNILGLLSIQYIWDFIKENDFDLGD